MRIFLKNNKGFAHKPEDRGFTLIELLVVIAIVGLLSSVIFASLNTARAKGRDTKRMSDLIQLRNALALYYSTNGSYPDTSSQWWGRIGGGSCGSYYIVKDDTTWITGLTTTYISTLPKDPKEDISSVGKCRIYLYKSNGKDYMLLAHYGAEGNIPNSFKRVAESPPSPYYSANVSFAVWSSLSSAGW